jgi:hypothetical protein
MVALWILVTGIIGAKTSTVVVAGDVHPFAVT